METYREFRERMQAETPDPDRCRHGMPLRTRCIACEDSEHIPHAVSQTVTTCPGCQHEAEQRRRWAALDALPCSHTIPGTCDYC